MAYFTVDILTPSKIVAQNLTCDSILIPTVNGEINVLPEHTHLVAKLETGVLTIKQPEGKDDHYILTVGICKVLNNKITILTQVAENKKEVDQDRAKHALERALKKLQTETLTDQEIRKFRRKEIRARTRLRLAEAYLK